MLVNAKRGPCLRDTKIRRIMAYAVISVQGKTMRRIKAILLIVLLIVAPAVFDSAAVHAHGRKEKKLKDTSLVSNAFIKEVFAAEERLYDANNIDSFVDWVRSRYRRAIIAEQQYLTAILLNIGASVDVKPVSKRVGPITLVVNDNETGSPLKDITVYYYLQKSRIINPNESEGITLELERLQTNNKGKVFIPARNYVLDEPLEYLTSAHFYINLDTDDNRIPTERELDHFDKVFLNSNRIDNDIIISNNAYFPTAVYNFGIDRNYSYFSGNKYLRYESHKPISGRMKISAKLARNNGEIDDNIKEGYNNLVNLIYNRLGNATEIERFNLNRMLSFLEKPVGGSVLKSVGPITLAVIDNETGLPLKDINVYYQLQKTRIIKISQLDDQEKALMGFNWQISNDINRADLAPTYYLYEHPIIAQEKLKTDTNGEIYIPARGYLLDEFLENYRTINFYINIDTNENKMQTDIYLYSFHYFRGTNNRFTGNILLANNRYYTTSVSIGNAIEIDERRLWTERSDGNFYMYYSSRPIEKAEMNISVKLARNTE